MAVTGYPSITRSRRSIPGPSVRRHESLCYSCEAGDDYGERYTACEEDSRGMGWTWLRKTRVLVVVYSMIAWALDGPAF